MAPDDGLAIGAANDGVAADDDFRDLVGASGGHRDRLTDAEGERWIDNGKLQERRLLLQRPAETLKHQVHRLSGCRDSCSNLQSGWIKVTVVEGFNPKAGRIDDLEQQILRLNDLAGEDAGARNDAVNRCAQYFRRNSGFKNGIAPLSQAR